MQEGEDSGKKHYYVNNFHWNFCFQENEEELRYHHKVFLPAEIETKTEIAGGHVGDVVPDNIAEQPKGGENVLVVNMDAGVESIEACM